MGDTFQVSNPARIMLGWSLLIAACAAILIGARLDWGMAAIVVVPALALLVPALALVERRRLLQHGDRLLVDAGLLRLRRLALPLQGCELELLPTAGWWTVCLHIAGRECAVGTWLRRPRAEALCAWLDTAAPEGRWPRRQRQPAEWDR